jgi:hypothetical protein
MMHRFDQCSDGLMMTRQTVGTPLNPREEDTRMGSEMIVAGAIIDSWFEAARTAAHGARLVLQVAPKGRPKDLVIVEAEPSLVPDRCWLEDLSENLCHGSPVLAVGRASFDGYVAATSLQLVR